MSTEQQDTWSYKPFKKLKSLMKKSESQRIRIKKESDKKKRTISAGKSGSVFQQVGAAMAPELDVSDDATLFAREVEDVIPLRQYKNPMNKKRGAEKSPVFEGVKVTETTLKEEFKKLAATGIGGAHADVDISKGNGERSFLFSKFKEGIDSLERSQIDLHGYAADEAKILFDDFLTESIENQRESVLVIHGRGLSSPGEPVLRKKVNEWLTRGKWRKWVVSSRSARPEDGGTGATAIILHTSRP